MDKLRVTRFLGFSIRCNGFGTYVDCSEKDFINALKEATLYGEVTQHLVKEDNVLYEVYNLIHKEDNNVYEIGYVGYEQKEL